MGKLLELTDDIICEADLTNPRRSHRRKGPRAFGRIIGYIFRNRHERKEMKEQYGEGEIVNGRGDAQGVILRRK